MPELRFFVDRITDGFATLLPEIGEGSVTVPESCIPGASEGDWLAAGFTADRGKKREMIREINDLMDDLENKHCTN
jgi:hypothetical protein